MYNSSIKMLNDCFQVHIRTHTRNYPYKCHIPNCDAKYPAWNKLYLHCQEKHGLDIRSDNYKRRNNIKEVTEVGAVTE